MISDFHRIMNIALLLWGCIFCLIAAFCLFLGRNYNKERRKWMLHMQLSTAALMGSDALAWIFRGYPEEVGYYMVRISNFLVFALTDLTLLLFQQYIACYLFDEKKRGKDIRIRAASLISVAGILMVVISQFTDLYYYFDAENFYHRNSAYVISMILPLICMLIDLSLLIQYRKKVSRETLLAMGSYIVLPVGAAAIQIVHYGCSLINVAIGCSMILMYITVTIEQNKEIGQLARSREEIEERLQIASILNSCVKELSSDSDVDEAINNLMKIVNGYFEADRSYIFEINFKRNILVNTYEYVKDMVTVQKDNLQEVPIDVIAVWMESFRKSEAYFISDVEKEKGMPSYEMLKEQDIYRLLAVPLMKDDKVIGFLGVDNPKSHYDDATLLASIQFFITSSLERKKEKEYLKYLSYRDKLTELYNRNRYIELIDGMKGQKLYHTGVAYIDLNGLKRVNDQEGHEAGDRLIRNAASVINDIFYDKGYRIGGDEFVVILCEIDEKEFIDRIKLLREKMDRAKISVSVGSIWKVEVDDLEKVLKSADNCMYEEKEEYYRVNKIYRR